MNDKQFYKHISLQFIHNNINKTEKSTRTRAKTVYNKKNCIKVFELYWQRNNYADIRQN